MIDRSLPNSEESERVILGAIILDPSLIHQAETVLLPEHFYRVNHRKVFSAMTALAQRQQSLEPALIQEESGEPLGWIANLTFGLPHATNISHYAKVVREKAILRDLIKVTAKIQEAAMEGDEEAQTILANAENELFGLAVQSRVSGSTVRTYEQIGSSVVEMFESWTDGNVVAIPTQIPELDHKLTHGGLSSKDFIVIAARTSFGKTALALQIALNSARAGIPVLIFSLEMSGEKLFIRNLSSVANVPHHHINPWTFQYNRSEASKIFQAVPKVSPLPIQVEDSTYSLNRLLAIARQWRQRNRNKKALLIADYIQLVHNRQDRRSRQEEVAGVSLELKRLAKELDVPVIGVSQFSREQAKQGRRPELSDLRESGQIEQDVDVALFPWSPNEIKDEEVRGLSLYCAKQRGGKVGWEIPIDFDADHQWFKTEEIYRTEKGVA